MKLLDKNRYNALAPNLLKVTINNLFARSVIEHCIPGKVYVDNYNNPQTFFVIHPYGMSLLYGDCNNPEFNTWLYDYALNKNKERKNHEWMQAYPGTWDNVLQDLFKDCIISSAKNKTKKEKGIIELNTRVNFKFDPKKYKAFRKENDCSSMHIVRTDAKMFKEMKGTVVPAYFWKDGEHFEKRGVGFSLFHKNKLASTAYSSFIHDDKLEFGIETLAAFRGKGLAQHTCSALIDYCIKNNYEPIWACLKENISSYKLAQKLGFEPIKEIHFYRLSK